MSTGPGILDINYVDSDEVVRVICKYCGTAYHVMKHVRDSGFCSERCRRRWAEEFGEFVDRIV